VLQNAENIHDLRYLPDDRYTGSQCSQGDWRKTLNLYLPKGAKGPLPLVIYVHGGGYGGGHKEEGYQVPLMQRLVDRGIAVASMNYILGTGIFPQVFWDFEDASRFLRTNAARYRLDPCAFGAVGISAGGWLISAAGHADGRTFATETNHFDHALTMRGPTWTSQQIRIGEGSFLRPVLAATTAYPGVYGRFQAMAFDFHMVPQAANGWTPAILQFCSIGTDRPHEAFAAAGVDWTAAVLTDPKEAGKGVHAPPWNAAARPLDGGADRELADVVVDWYARTLTGPMARTPVAEIWPTQRFISAPIDVSILVPDASITVHVTTDGSEPNTASPRYTAPFRIVPGTTVRALSVMRGRKPSRVVDAVFASSTQLPAFRCTFRPTRLPAALHPLVE
jgi:hypothetical protein